MKTARKSSTKSLQRQRLNLRMSKISRILQSKMVKTNWAEMAKMLFRGDTDPGRRDMLVRLPRSNRRSSQFEESVHKRTTDQEQYFLVLTFVITIAEKRSQEIYQKEFSDRCDSISVNHGLDEDQYWHDEDVPVEWQKLDAEFEQRSMEILQDTLREYSMDAIADEIAAGGSDAFMKLIRSLEYHALTTAQAH